MYQINILFYFFNYLYRQWYFIFSSAHHDIFVKAVPDQGCKSLAGFALIKWVEILHNCQDGVFAGKGVVVVREKLLCYMRH